MHVVIPEDPEAKGFYICFSFYTLVGKKWGVLFFPRPNGPMARVVNGIYGRPQSPAERRPRVGKGYQR